MASAGEAEAEYESDPEEAKLSLKMRRREASDDEEEEEREPEERENSHRRVESDGESEGQGAAADYDEEEEEEYDDEEYGEDEEDEYEEAGGIVGDGHEESVTDEVEAVAEGADGVKVVVGKGTGSGQGIGDGNENNVLPGEEEEKKENEPFAVPTAGAFYMHDDRFRDNAGGRHRRTFGGRNLWESKDDRKWGHDKFEELSVEERNYEEGRRASRGRYRGRGRGRGPERGTVRARRPKADINDNIQGNNNNQKIQNNASKGMRGRGPRRYRPSFKDNIGAPPPPNKQSGLSAEKLSHHSTAKASTPVSNVENDAVAAAKLSFVSSLNSASPPFYPSSSSTKGITTTDKRELQTGTSSRSAQPSVLGDSSAAARSTVVLRGKNVGDSISLDKLNIADPITAVAAKPSSGLQLPPGSSTINPTQSQPLRGQGRGFNAMPLVNYQSPVINNQFNRVSQPINLSSTHRNPVQSRGQPSFQVAGQQFAQRSGTGSQGSSPPKTGQSISETREIESSLDSSKSKSAMVAKGKGTLQSTGRGSVLHGGAQVMGAPGSVGGGDQNFPATPTFLPVMQFGGQHRGGIGVPAVGMAFPGYVGGGLGNSEMTWLPVLAGAAGALGATYCSPYFAVDGAYNARPSGQISSLTTAPSKENNAGKPNNECNPQQRPELSNDDLGQRQKNPRRYTEMKFDQ